MMIKPVRTMDDDRPITMITFPFQDGNAPSLTIGCTLFGSLVTKIVAYEEPGELGPVLWYAIYGQSKQTVIPDGTGTSAVSREIRFPEALLYRIQAKYVEAVGYQEQEGSDV